MGRFDREDGELAYLKDVGVHRDGEGSWDDYLQRTKLYGVKIEHRQVTIPRSEIESVRKFSEGG